MAHSRHNKPVLRQSQFSIRRRTGFTLVEIMIVVLIIGILLAIAVPSFINARETARSKACVSNLVELYSATEQYALDYHLAATTAINPATFMGLSPPYLLKFPVCPSGGNYAPGATIGDNPTCDISGTTGAPSPTGVGDFAPPTAPHSMTGAGRYYHGLP